MDWIRENKVLAAIVGFSLAGAAALAAFLVLGYLSYSETLGTFETVNGSLARLKGEKLAPTPENLDAKRKAVDDYRAAVDKLSLVLYTLQAEEKPISETDFQAKLKARIVDAKKAAAEVRVGLPAEFNLAFDKYTSTLPKNAAVASELSSYLDAVNEIARMFIASNITSLDSLERSDLKSESDAPAPAAPKVAKTPVRVAPGAKPGAAAGPAVETIVERRQVRAVLTTDQFALQTIVNKLASPSEMPNLPFFAVVRLLRIENAKQEGPLKSEVSTSSLGAGAGLPAVTAPPPPATANAAGVKSKEEAAAASIIRAAPADAVAVLGKEPLRVYLEIDLVKFIQPATASK